MLASLGPGVVIAGSIVGSGELIATTKVGAEAGFTLLWLILIGCAIKVFVQVELGRHTVTWRQTPLDALNSVPGPRIAVTRSNRKLNWIMLCWVVMTMLVVLQQGGIVGGVGEAMAISMPLTERGERYNELKNELTADRVRQATESRNRQAMPAAPAVRLSEKPPLEAELEAEFPGGTKPLDARLWATAFGVATSVILYFGSYGLIQTVATILVAGFTLVTFFTLAMLQWNPSWAVSGSELAQGLSFQLPPRTGETHPLMTALAAFGLIGVGAGELIMYPYWCMEKGYARFTGPRDGSAAWLGRARGWMRIMQFDAWGSLVVYTFATLAFYMLGAAVLWRSGLNPGNDDMVRTLGQMYVPVFGQWAQPVFLVGAFAVLYSTLFVVAAGNGRMIADALGIAGLTADNDATRRRWTARVCAAWPMVAVALLWLVQAPVAMVLASGLAQSIMLPILGGAAIYFRYKRSDPDLKPGRLWDALLTISVVGLCIVGAVGVWSVLDKLGFLN